MQRIHQKIGRALFGARVVSLLLSGCNGANTPDPTPNPNPAPKPDTKPEEGKTILKFKVRALTVNNAEIGFRVYNLVQQIEVAVAKGKTTATKTALLEAIKAKDPEMEEIDEIQLYKADKTNANVYSENDEGLKNNANVFIGKDTYTRKVELTLQSITAEKNGYMPIARYSSGVKLTVSVGHADDAAAVTKALRDEIEKTVRGDNYDRLYKLFSDAAGESLAYARDFVDKGTIYIGKKALNPKIMLKPVASRTVRNAQGYIYSGLTTTSPNPPPLVAAAGVELTLDEAMPDNTSAERLRELFEEKIRATLAAVTSGIGDENYDYLCGLFVDKAGKRPATAADFKDGATIYAGRKIAKSTELKIFSITKDAQTVQATAATTATLEGTLNIVNLTKPLRITVEADIEVGGKVNVTEFMQIARDTVREKGGQTLFPANKKISFCKAPRPAGNAAAAVPLADTDIEGFGALEVVYVATMQ